jgi:hypothetical protein
MLQSGCCASVVETRHVGCEPKPRSYEPNGVISLQATKDIAMPTAGSHLKIKNCVVISGLLIAALSPCVAAAALGEPESSVQSDVAQMRGSIKLTEHASYRVHEIQSPSGTLVREFVGSDGKVFALAWNGPVAPNLRQTLGRYFDNYVAAAKTSHSGHHQLQFQSGDLVVQASGHMRLFSGRAYLQPAVPAGISIGDLR